MWVMGRCLGSSPFCLAVRAAGSSVRKCGKTVGTKRPLTLKQI